MKDLLKPYARLVEFLGPVLGPDYEIVLQDVGEENCIVAIANGSISGRSVGAPLTNKAREIIAGHRDDEGWERNYLGVSDTGKTLRSSTCLIKDEKGAIAGLFCVNFCDSRFRELQKQVLRMCHPDDFAREQGATDYVPAMLLASTTAERFPATAEDTLSEIVARTVADSATPVGRMNQKEKTSIVERLEHRGVFAIKGAVSQVSHALGSSEATIYRYLAKVRRSGEEYEGLR